MPRITAPKPYWLAALLSLLWMGSASLQAAPQLTPLHNRPVAFEENRGQTDPQVKYLSHGQGYTLFLTPEEAVLALHGAGQTGSILRLRWVDGVASPRMTADGPLPGVTHYLTGSDPSRWRTGVPSWERVRYEEVWPGIDLVFYGNPRQLEYDVVVAPGADLGRVRLAFEGAEELRLESAGDLVVRVGGEEVRLHRPVSSQEVNGARRSIESSWRLVPGALEAGFRVGAYDRSRPLVIDPVLVYSTYLAGSGDDLLTAVATDAEGNTYVTGRTDSVDFPAIGTIRPPRSRDVFVSKLDPNGELVWTTLLGGAGGDAASGIAVDAEGHIAVTGSTGSRDFPRIGTTLPLRPYQGWISDLFIARLDPSGSSLLWSARIGGSDLDAARGLAVDPAGHLYVVGTTYSWDFPVHAALQPSVTDMGYINAFLMKLTPDGDFVYSTYLSGSRQDYARGVEADPAGFAYVIGETNSIDFPLRNATQPALGGGWGDVFVLRVAPDGSALVWSTFLGGSAGESGGAIALDREGSVYVTGTTWSFDFPIRNALQPVNTSRDSYTTDAFVARLSPAGSLEVSTYLGGSASDEGEDVAVDAQGSAWVTGLTESADFPVRDALQAECWPDRPASGHDCSRELFLAQLTPAGDALVQASYLGGTWDETDTSIAIDPAGFLSLAGSTFSTDFPMVRAFQPSPGGILDGFVLRMAPPNRPPDCSASFVRPATLWPPNGRLVPVSIPGVTDPDGDPVTLRVTAIRQDEPLTKAGAPDAAGLGTARPMLRASRAGNGDGRVYHIAFEATDPAGAACTGTLTVCVPHDQGKPACGDGGPLVDSAGGR